MKNRQHFCLLCLFWCPTPLGLWSHWVYKTILFIRVLVMIPCMRTIDTTLQSLIRVENRLLVGKSKGLHQSFDEWQCTTHVKCSFKKFAVWVHSKHSRFQNGSTRLVKLNIFTTWSPSHILPPFAECLSATAILRECRLPLVWSLGKRFYSEKVKRLSA